MKVTIRENIPRFAGLSKEEIILFFAKINERIGYCVIYGPIDKCIPTDSNLAELFDAKVAFGKLDVEMKVVPVKHGHKYKEGGGMVETELGSIGWRLNIKERPCIYENREIEEVIVAT